MPYTAIHAAHGRPRWLRARSVSVGVLVVATVAATVAVSGSAYAAANSMYWPVSGQITQNIRNPSNPGHEGIDIGVPVGTPVAAAQGGTVVQTQPAALGGDAGNYVSLDNGGGYFTRYLHLDGFNVGVGQQVRRGDVIGFSGNTGHSSGPHLHFEVRFGSSANLGDSQPIDFDNDPAYAVGRRVNQGDRINYDFPGLPDHDGPPPPPPPVPSAGTFGLLVRYFSGTGDHLSGSGAAPWGYRFEYVLGLAPMLQLAGTVPLMQCAVGGDSFSSTDPGCEGQQVLGRSGFVYTDPPAGIPAQAIYRCTTGDGEHFDSLDGGCEGQHTEGRLGYTEAKALLARYYTGLGDHWSTSGFIPDGFAYTLEGVLGMLPTVPTPGTLVLMQCSANGDFFTSTDPGCEGRQIIARSGYIYASPPAGVPVQPVYRCTTGDGEHFDSLDGGCEGQHTEGRLGYTEAKALLTRYFSIYGDHNTATNPQPPGYFYEGTLGAIPTQPLPGTIALMQCRTGGDSFTSTDPGCEGQQVITRSGYLYINPPTSQPAQAIYRCTDGDGEHFDSTDPNCEGQHTEGRLGYTLPH